MQKKKKYRMWLVRLQTNVRTTNSEMPVVQRWSTGESNAYERKAADVKERSGIEPCVYRQLAETKNGQFTYFLLIWYKRRLILTLTSPSKSESEAWFSN